jgi:hypothetical protein
MEMWQKCSHIRSASCQPGAGCEDCLSVETLRRFARGEVGVRREARSRPDGSKRTEFRQSVTRSGVGRVDRVNLSVGVGTAVRRSVTLHSLPPAMPNLVSAYRRDRYNLLRDDIVTIESDTCAIADVIRG